jgi:thioredoxin reductase
MRGEETAMAIEDNLASRGVRRMLGVENLRLEKSEDGFRVECRWRGGEVVATSKFAVLATGSQPAVPEWAGPNMAIGPGVGLEDLLNKKPKSLAIIGGGDNAGDAFVFAKKRGIKVKVFSRSAPKMQSQFLRLIGDEMVVGEQKPKWNGSSWDVAGEKFEACAAMLGYEARLPAMAFHVPMVRGRVVVNERAKKMVEGLYAIGEVADRMHPCMATAQADGVVAAKDIEAKLKKKSEVR